MKSWLTVARRTAAWTWWVACVTLLVLAACATSRNVESAATSTVQAGTARQAPKLVPQLGHALSVHTAEFSPDGSRAG